MTEPSSAPLRPDAGPADVNAGRWYGSVTVGHRPADVQKHAWRVYFEATQMLEELLERFRSIARGVYPSVLRDQGPAAALEELIADLPRAVRLESAVDRRLAWEVESGVYYLAASAVQHLAARPGDPELRLRLTLGGGRLAVRVEDPAPGADADALAEALAIDAERLDALGGTVELGTDAGAVVVHGRLPERLEPQAEPAAAPGAGP